MHVARQLISPLRHHHHANDEMKVEAAADRWFILQFVWLCKFTIDVDTGIWSNATASFTGGANE